VGRPVIDNRPGGNTVIASQALLSDKDGHTLLLPGIRMLVPYLSEGAVAVRLLKDFQPVASLARTGLFLVVTPSLPAADLKEFIALAKASRGR
jgi:tripartite-type tricarboxylate transporter receptor subunit TctC